MKAKTHFLRVLRIVLASVMFVGLMWLLVDSTGVLPRYLGWMAKVQFLPAVLSTFVTFSLASFLVVAAILVVTWLFGRVYCSVICPLGIMQDVYAWLGGRKWLKKVSKRFGRNRWQYEGGHPKLRNAILIVFCVLLVFWHPIASIIAPYSAFARMIASFGGKASGLTLGVSIVLFVIISLWAFFKGRAWCNTICPVGTTLGAVAKHSVFRPTIDKEKCTGCRACERNCKAQCIDAATHTVDGSRCVDCFDCLDNCSTGAIAFGTQKSRDESQGARVESQGSSVKGQESRVGSREADSNRRRFLGMLGALAATGIASAQHKTDGGLAVIEQKRVPDRSVPLRPAGSMSLRRFTQLCTSCQLCVTACPEHVLRPSTDLATLMQPEMQFDKGYCLTGCTRCSSVCPTGAILPITKEEKTTYQIGHAVWIRQNCVVETDGVSCGNCARHCPTGAILMVENEQGRLIPAVDTEKCIGCGHCEYVCPSRPFSAIYVEGHLQHRKI